MLLIKKNDTFSKVASLSSQDFHDCVVYSIPWSNKHFSIPPEFSLRDHSPLNSPRNNSVCLKARESVTKRKKKKKKKERHELRCTRNCCKKRGNEIWRLWENFETTTRYVEQAKFHGSFQASGQEQEEGAFPAYFTPARSNERLARLHHTNSHARTDDN